jgi:RNA polymerase-interacting CarD/CdnL/TRCF family regulator
MKTHAFVFQLVIASLIALPAQDAPTLDHKLAAAKVRHALVQDARSGERAAALQAAMSGVNADPEVARLWQALARANANFLTGKGDPQKIAEISAALQKRQQELLEARHPELKDYLRSRLAYRDELLKLRHENKADEAAQLRLQAELKALD